MKYNLFVVANNLGEFSINVLEEVFWEYYPHEVTWQEVKDLDPEVYYSLLLIGERLVGLGQLDKAYLPKGEPHNRFDDPRFVKGKV